MVDSLIYSFAEIATLTLGLILWVMSLVWVFWFCWKLEMNKVGKPKV